MSEKLKIQIVVRNVVGRRVANRSSGRRYRFQPSIASVKMRSHEQSSQTQENFNVNGPGND
jgi:hypothetical protein